MTDPKQRVVFPKVCSNCGTRCTPEGDFNCGCLASWRASMIAINLCIALTVLAMIVLPILLLLKGSQP